MKMIEQFGRYDTALKKYLKSELAAHILLLKYHAKIDAKIKVNPRQVLDAGVAMAGALAKAMTCRELAHAMALFSGGSPGDTVYNYLRRQAKELYKKEHIFLNIVVQKTNAGMNLMEIMYFRDGLGKSPQILLKFIQKIIKLAYEISEAKEALSIASGYLSHSCVYNVGDKGKLIVYYSTLYELFYSLKFTPEAFHSHFNIYPLNNQIITILISLKWMNHSLIKLKENCEKGKVPPNDPIFDFLKSKIDEINEIILE